MAKKPIEAPATPGGLLVYAGPNVRTATDSFLTGQTYETLPASARDNANLKALFVQIPGYAEAKREIGIKGSRLYNAAQAVLAAASTKEA